jgi:hypothetical protein
MIKEVAGPQIGLFINHGLNAAPPRSDAIGNTAAAPEAVIAVGFEEALANARAFLAAPKHGTAEANMKTGAFRSKPVHLPDRPEGPEIYALCPGCELHPGGGIFPASELVRAEGCPTGDRLTAASDSCGEGECRGADREGSALPGTERADAPRPFLSPVSFIEVGVLGALGATGMKSGVAVAARRFAAAAVVLTAPVRLCSGLRDEALRRLRRAWYFHRRRAICRDRLSRIASNPSWTS